MQNDRPWSGAVSLHLTPQNGPTLRIEGRLKRHTAYASLVQQGSFVFARNPFWSCMLLCRSLLIKQSNLFLMETRWERAQLGEETGMECSFVQLVPDITMNFIKFPWQLIGPGYKICRAPFQSMLYFLDQQNRVQVEIHNFASFAAAICCNAVPIL